MTLQHLKGDPIALTSEAVRELKDVLQCATGEELALETYGLLCLARLLHKAGADDAARQVIDIAMTATIRLREHNAERDLDTEGAALDAKRRFGLGTDGAQAPRLGEPPAEGSVSVGDLVAARPRKIV